ncbi:MAG: hypothetical protein QM784_11805 [Polyangiaceae bacterium]
MGRARALSTTFFNRNLPRCVVVDATRNYLERTLVNALRHDDRPEYVLPLAALFLSGDPWDCENVESSPYTPESPKGAHLRPCQSVGTLVTGLPAKEVEEYLSLACPYRATPTTLLEPLVAYGLARSGSSESDSIDAKGFATALQELRGGCVLEPKERDALVAAQRFAERLSCKWRPWPMASPTRLCTSGRRWVPPPTTCQRFSPAVATARKLLDEVLWERPSPAARRDLRGIPSTGNVQPGDTLTAVNRFPRSQDRKLRHR